MLAGEGVCGKSVVEDKCPFPRREKRGEIFSRVFDSIGNINSQNHLLNRFPGILFTFAPALPSLAFPSSLPRVSRASASEFLAES